MRVARTAHVDTFCRDHLPPGDAWPDLVFDLPELHYPDWLNCADSLLDDTVRRLGPDRPCLRTETGTWTYGDLLSAANRAAHVLTDHCGLRPGNRVLLRGPNNPWLVAAWFAVLKAGGVAVTTMPLLRAREIADLVELTKPDLAICDHRFLDELALGAPELPVLGYGGPGPDDLTALASSTSDTFTSVATAADDVAILAPTSGTTGKPKATMHFHRDLLICADTFSRHIVRPNQDDVFAGSPPIGFTFGLGGLVLFPLRAGASTLLLERATPVELADAVAKHRVTVLFTAPTAYRAMLAGDKASALTGLRRCVSAGEHLPTATWRDFLAKTGIRIINGIGGTEMLHIYIAAADEEIRPGSTGRVVPGFHAVILDENGDPVPDGVSGRLAVKGPTGCRYLSDERQRTTVHRGWTLTGDSYHRDADGYYWFEARNDDMIVSSGYNIAGPEVEAALLDHPDVLDVAVIGAPDAERGTVVKAFVVPRAESTVTAGELQDFVKHALAPYKYPREVVFLDALPRTATGKVQRYRLRSMPPSGRP
ncbi:AMP-binding protein [Kutzneria sp. CA-103260]|uniref:AMP-binding protein n=1 Tax=Kutzneria sp. CA-103260 TaxID=2802641 RepID=UPI001BAE1664|nr:AMP-binding protein [Kutzneria sp. CA-103260]QUQ62515.1 acetyl-CoA synthetase [Kutzneria sp. CA-103260]